MRLCEKAKATALSILRDAEAPYWDKAEAESYLRSETIRPFVWKANKVVLWEVGGSWVTLTKNPNKVFRDWLNEALAEA